MSRQEAPDPQPTSGPQAPPLRLGLLGNWRQFVLLVVVNAFVGAMVGQERAILPLVAQDEFGIAAGTAVTSFILAFGLAKAACNLLAGPLADSLGRRRVLVAGWLIGLPVPLVVGFAPAWSWIVAANVLLGINQGLTWTMTLAMKVDLAGPERRGLAVGFNEFSGYFALGLAAWGSTAVAAMYGPRPAPFTIGIVAALLGLALSALFVRETGSYVHAEAGRVPRSADTGRSFAAVFYRVTWRDRGLFACSQAGLVNNLNDALAWGMLPLFFAARGLSLAEIGLLAAAYPAVWSVSQLATGPLSDRVGRKLPIVGGLALQGLFLLGTAQSDALGPWLACAVGYGLGTALVYPTLIAAVADAAHPTERASALGVYRFWRDSGYAVGALAAGVVADAMGLDATILVIAAITLGSAAVVGALFHDRRVAQGAPDHV